MMLGRTRVDQRVVYKDDRTGPRSGEVTGVRGDRSHAWVSFDDSAEVELVRVMYLEPEVKVKRKKAS